MVGIGDQVNEPRILFKKLGVTQILGHPWLSYKVQETLGQGQGQTVLI